MKRILLASVFTITLLLSSCGQSPSEMTANNECCVCSGTGKESTNSGYQKCGTCYGLGRLTDGRYSSACK